MIKWKQNGLWRNFWSVTLSWDWSLHTILPNLPKKWWWWWLWVLSKIDGLITYWISDGDEWLIECACELWIDSELTLLNQNELNDDYIEWTWTWFWLRLLLGESLHASELVSKSSSAAAGYPDLWSVFKFQIKTQYRILSKILSELWRG